jgi:hypothetical protein
VYAAAEFRRRDLVELATRAWASTLSPPGCPAARQPRLPDTAALLSRLGLALVRIGERLRGSAGAADPGSFDHAQQAVTTPAPACGDRSIVGLERRRPACRRVVWPAVRDLVAEQAVAAAEDLIRQHQRR